MVEVDEMGIDRTNVGAGLGRALPRATARFASRWRLAALLMLVILAIAGHGEARRIRRARAEAPSAGAASAEAYRAAALMEASSGEILFEKDGHHPWPPASMTKMMLMLLVAERVRDGQLHWDDPITTSRHASKIGGSQVYLKEGETFPLGEMMQAIIIHSANDAAVAVAEAVAGFLCLFRSRCEALDGDSGRRSMARPSRPGAIPCRLSPVFPAAQTSTATAGPR